MNLLPRFFLAFACLEVAATSRLSNRHHQSNFVTGATHFDYYHAPTSRASPSLGHHYAAVISHVAQAGSKFGHIKSVPILRNDYNSDGSGNYHFGFETGNGIKRDESGHFQGSWPGGSIKIAGSYSYTGDDGKLYSINYKADSHGFRAEGDHLPTPPPIPREIQETLHLHRHGGKPRSSIAARAFPVIYSNGGLQSSVSASHPSKASARVPNINYLPPQRNQEYLYGSL